MADTPSRQPTRSSSGTPPANDVRDELKRTLDRDTAVQGESEEDVAPTTGRPGQADSSRPVMPPAPPGHGRSK